MTASAVAVKLRGLQRAERRLAAELELTRTEIAAAARLLEAEAEAERQAKIAAQLEVERRRAAKAEQKVAQQRERRELADLKMRIAAVAVASAASTHFARSIKSRVLLDHGGSRRVETARTVLIWLASTKFELTNTEIAECLHRDRAAITRRLRPLTLEEATIARGALFALPTEHKPFAASQTEAEPRTA